jgi:hypothetical protein
VRRKLLALAGFVSGALAGSVLYRRAFGRGDERIDLYFDDGSFVTFEAASATGGRLLPLARQVLTAAGHG